MRRRYGVFLGLLTVLLIFGLGLLAYVRLSDPARQLTEQFEGPASFTIRYPGEWVSLIPEMGIMVLAEAETLGGQPGPSVTIKRDSTLMLEGSLTATLETYLARGPEARGDWERLTDIIPFTLADNRDAVMIDLQGRELEQDPVMHVRLVIARADNMVVYVVALSAPPATWADNEPLLNAMMDSLQFTE